MAALRMAGQDLPQQVLPGRAVERQAWPAWKREAPPMKELAEERTEEQPRAPAGRESHRAQAFPWR